ncbi:hypothetical protein QQA45_04740 [Sneathia sanguinegens]|uniref:Uncharacterized protein n=1 Tax=Sneathia sanguinegens TaxID=40543 RepID=A0ABT7HJW8_9FUSO|nr:hypothetical protein [Sneathia sanguinegens]MDK9580822.1 hypothetical protein [Sneathia sanguinegens]
MEKEEVLKLEYTKINDDYTIATITYQNDEILKRDAFYDNELKVISGAKPEFVYPFLYVRGYKTELDNLPITIPNKHLEFVKEKVRKLNEKYGVVKKWCPNINDNYYTISFSSVNNVHWNSWHDSITENRLLEKNLIFKNKDEASFVADKILKNVNKWREEYQKGEER